MIDLSRQRVSSLTDRFVTGSYLLLRCTRKAPVTQNSYPALSITPFTTHYALPSFEKHDGSFGLQLVRIEPGGTKSYTIRFDDAGDRARTARLGMDVLRGPLAAPALPERRRTPERSRDPRGARRGTIGRRSWKSAQRGGPEGRMDRAIDSPAENPVDRRDRKARRPIPARRSRTFLDRHGGSRPSAGADAVPDERRPHRRTCSRRPLIPENDLTFDVLSRSALLLVGAGIAGAACAEGLPLTGVWTGTLDNDQIIACFEGSDSSRYGEGSYSFLHRYPAPIRLKSIIDSSGGLHWLEETGEKAIWTFERATENRAEGRRWTSTKEPWGAPIRLDAEPGSDANACGSRVPTRERLGRTRIEVNVDTLPGIRGGCLRTLSANEGNVGGSWLESCDTGEVAERINAALPMGIVRAAWGSTFGMACSRDDNFTQEFWESTRPTLKTSRYLGVLRETFCICNSCYFGVPGADHGIPDVEPMAFDRRTGEKVDLWSWMRGADTMGRAPSEGLLALIRAKDSLRVRDSIDACAARLGGEIRYLPGLDSLGMIFASDYDDCRPGSGRIRIPYEELMPFLTPEGAEEIGSIQRDLKSRLRAGFGQGRRKP